MTWSLACSTWLSLAASLRSLCRSRLALRTNVSWESRVAWSSCLSSVRTCGAAEDPQLKKQYFLPTSLQHKSTVKQGRFVSPKPHNATFHFFYWLFLENTFKLVACIFKKINTLAGLWCSPKRVLEYPRLEKRCLSYWRLVHWLM